MLNLSKNEELFKAVAKKISKTKKQYDKYIESGKIEDSDLKKVKELKLECKSLSGIEQLTSLTKLNLNYNPPTGINEYSSTISKLERLKKLKIVGDFNGEINLENNSNLNNIFISSKDVTKITGAEKINCLNKGRKKLSFQLKENAMLENMTEFMTKINKKNTKQLVLPLLSLAREKHKNPNVLETLYDNDANIKFQSEIIGDSMSVQDTIKFDEEIDQMKNQLQLSKKNVPEKLYKVFDYMCLNFQHAVMEEKKNNRLFRIQNEKLRKIASVLEHKKGISTTLTSIFNYVLQSEGIDAYSAYGDLLIGGKHCMSRVQTADGYSTYYDLACGIPYTNWIDYSYFHMPEKAVRKYCNLKKTFKSGKRLTDEELHKLMDTCDSNEISNLSRYTNEVPEPLTYNEVKETPTKTIESI